MTPSAAREVGRDRVDIAIVGGGISGLYCALQLAQCIADRKPLVIGGKPVDYGASMPSIGLYEMRGLFGGRIETWTLDLRSARTAGRHSSQPLRSRDWSRTGRTISIGPNSVRCESSRETSRC